MEERKEDRKASIIILVGGNDSKQETMEESKEDRKASSIILVGGNDSKQETMRGEERG